MKKLLLLLFAFNIVISFAQKKKTDFEKNWTQFEEKYGNTLIDWKETTQTPHRVICNPIKLANSIQSKSQLKGLLLNFIEENKAVFNIETNQLKVRSIQKVKHTWYASFIQTYNGLDVVDSEIIFRVHQNGNLFLFGYDYYNVDFVSNASRPVTEIKNNLKSRYSIENIVIKQHEGLKILPVLNNGVFEYKPVYEIKASNKTDVSELLYVDATTSKVLKSYNKIHKDVQGTTQAQIIPVAPTDAPVFQNLPNLRLTIEGNQVTTDENGNFNYTLSGNTATLSAGLNGAFVSISNFNLPNASIIQSVSQNDNVNLIWNNSNSSIEERNVYYHINLIHANNKLVDPNFTNLDFPLQCIVNDTNTNALCNAFWNGTNLHFGVQAAGCSINSAHGASVIYHEYGHAINDKIYQQAGVSSGLLNPTLHEAFSDIYSTLLLNDSRFALGWFGPGTFTRNVNNNNIFPNNIIGQQHSDGLILGGAFWDLGLLTSPETAYQLAHFAKYGTPDDNDIAVAFSEAYFETLVADDDDGNLMNGTPNSVAIENAFCQHGIGSNLFAVQKLNHTPHANTLDTTNDYRVEINLPQSPFISIALGNINLNYSINNFNTTNTISLSQVNNTTYEAFIPAHPEGTLVKYYFELPNIACGSLQLYHPSSDFLNENYSFLVGNYVLSFDDNFDTNKGWQIGDFSDNATSGLWTRGNPQQTLDDTGIGTGFIVQPEDDFSLNGVNCLVTGSFRGGAWFSNDVDGGKTTIASPVFNNLDDTSVIEFYKWFVHGAGFVFPNLGQWKMEITNNGTNWIIVENTTYGDHRYWINSKYKISDIVSVTNQIQIRFVASDFGSGSIVEALVDDFNIYTLSALSISDESFSNVSVYPNPVENEINFKFRQSNGSEITIEIYNYLGQLIETLNTNPTQTDFVIKWIKPESFSSGIYFAQINTNNGNYITKKIIFK